MTPVPEQDIVVVRIDVYNPARGITSSGDYQMQVLPLPPLSKRH